MGRNWNRKNSENTQDKGWKRKERFQTYLKRNAVAVKRKIVIKPVTEISPNKKHFQTLRRNPPELQQEEKNNNNPKTKARKRRRSSSFASRTKFPLLENRDPLSENVCSHFAILFSYSANFVYWIVQGLGTWKRERSLGEFVRFALPLLWKYFLREDRIFATRLLFATGSSWQNLATTHYENTQELAEIDLNCWIV
jgi:hypothetical protein